MSSREPITVSNIGLYFGFEECPKYFKQSLGPRRGDKGELSLLLSGAGERFEREIINSLNENASRFIDASQDEDWGLSEDYATSIQHLNSTITQVSRRALESDDLVLVYQAPLRATVGAWPVTGKADLLAFWSNDGKLFAHVIEIKSSQDTQPYHQIQAATYSLILNRHLEVADLNARVSAGVVHRQSEELDPSEPSTFPSIPDLPVVQADVERLLAVDGRLDEIASQDNVRYRLSGKCNYCLYNESCFKEATNSLNLALLGLTEGEQQVLESHGITTVGELASLKRKPEDPLPWEFRELNSVDDAKVKALLNEPIIGDKLDEIVQRAQGLLGRLKPDHEHAADEPWIRPLLGSGNGTLPKDNLHSNEENDVSYSSGSLIRCYIHIRPDYMRNTIGLISARIQRTNYSEGAQAVSYLSPKMSDDPEAKLREEGELLSEFFTELFRAIDTVAGEDGEVPLHLYFFSRMERDSLIDATKRHITRWDVESFGAIRDLLGLRQAIDQPMVSILQDELLDRYEIKYSSTGLLPVLESLYNKWCECGCGGGTFGRDQWVATRQDGTRVDLWEVFKPNFFNFKKPAVETPNGLKIRDTDDWDDFYPAKARFDAQIPLEYLWAVTGKLDEQWATDGRDYWEIWQYQWHDVEERQIRITSEDIELLGEKICHAMEHIDIALGGNWGKFHNAYLGKEPIPIPEIPTFTLGESTLVRASQEYIDLEHFTRRQNILSNYAKSPRERVRNGKSVIVKIERTEFDGDDLLVNGKLVYDDREFAIPAQVANACRLKGQEGATSGSHGVANRVYWDEDRQMHLDQQRHPKDIEKGVPIEVAKIDIPDREITFRLSEFAFEFCKSNNMDVRYIQTHRSWVDQEHEDGGWNVYFDEGDTFILDESSDSWPAEHCHEVFERINDNPDPFYQTMTSVMEGSFEG